SGSGKTTLLAVMSAMLLPDAGDVFVDGLPLGQLSERCRAAFRRRETGFVFQAYRLMDSLTAEENIRLSLEMRGMGRSRAIARTALEAVGMRNKAHLYPRTLSG